MSQGPFSLSTFRRNKSLLGPGSDNGSRMLVGSRITGKHIQVQVPGPFPESDMLVGQGEARDLRFQQAPQEIRLWGHTSHSRKCCTRRSQDRSLLSPLCGPWAGRGQGWEGSEGTFFIWGLPVSFISSTSDSQEELGALCISPYRQTGRHLKGYDSVLVTL